jgi:hypothetical protein
MTERSTQPEHLTDDETRLLIFFRALIPSQQFDLLATAGQQAWDRCMPGKSIYRSTPCVAGIDPEPIPASIWGEEVRGTIFEIIRNAIEATGDPKHYLFGSDAFDETEAVPRFASAAEETADRQGTYFNYDRAFARKYIRAWRMEIARVCRCATRMARSIAEAEKQHLRVPDSPDDWIYFTLMLDGERIAEELDWHRPGQFDCDLRGTLAELDQPSERHQIGEEPALSPVLMMRMALYERLRFLQTRDNLPASSEQLQEIGEVLSWLRDRVGKE